MITVYSTFIKNAFLKMLAYRLRYYTGVVNYLVYVSVYYFIWKAIYDGAAAGQVLNGYSFSQMLTYIAIGWIARSSYFSNVDREVNDLVETGQVSVFLTRPVNFQAMMLMQALGESLFRILFFSLPLGIVIFLIFPLQAPASSVHFLLFVVATAIGFFVMAALNFAVGLLSFYVSSIQGVLRAKYNIVNLCSGLLLPLSFFPGWLQSVLELLPFQALAYVPLNLYLGKVPLEQASLVILQQAVWLVALLLLGHFMWERAASRLTLQGG